MLFTFFASSRQARGKNRGRAAPLDADFISLCRSIRIMSERDVDGTVVHVFRTVLAKRGSPFGSTEVSRISRLNRITCIHHLKRLAAMGIVDYDEREEKYSLRYESIEDMVEEMRERMLSMFEDAEKIAKRIDGEIEEEGHGKRGEERRKLKARQ